MEAGTINTQAGILHEVQPTKAWQQMRTGMLLIERLLYENMATNENGYDINRTAIVRKHGNHMRTGMTLHRSAIVPTLLRHIGSTTFNTVTLSTVTVDTGHLIPTSLIVPRQLVSCQCKQMSFQLPFESTRISKFLETKRKIIPSFRPSSAGQIRS